MTQTTDLGSNTLSATRSITGVVGSKKFRVSAGETLQLVRINPAGSLWDIVVSVGDLEFGCDWSDVTVTYPTSFGTHESRLDKTERDWIRLQVKHGEEITDILNVIKSCDGITDCPWDLLKHWEAFQEARN